jgi:hypothetical protein
MSEQIDQFFSPDGTLISIPVKLPKKLGVLRHIASELSPDSEFRTTLVYFKRPTFEISS